MKNEVSERDFILKVCIIYDNIYKKHIINNDVKNHWGRCFPAFCVSPNGYVSPVRFYPLGCSYSDTLVMYGVYSYVNCLLTFVGGYGFMRSNVIR